MIIFMKGLGVIKIWKRVKNGARIHITFLYLNNYRVTIFYILVCFSTWGIIIILVLIFTIGQVFTKIFVKQFVYPLFNFVYWNMLTTNMSLYYI